MKAVLISIQPKWCEKIASGEKTIEVRKSRPKLKTPFKVYIYATKPKKWFRFSSWGYASDENLWLSNGKVKMCDGFEFWAGNKEYEPLCCKVIGEFVCKGIMRPFDSLRLMAKQSCVNENELFEYSNGKTLYGWRIADLEIYDKPKELSEFAKAYPIKCGKGYESIDCKGCGSEFTCTKRFITRPPQSWCYVEAKQ